MKNISTYNYNFENGTIIVTRGIRTKFDWFLTVKLNKDAEGNKQFIFLDKNIFLTRKQALVYANSLLSKYKLL